MFVCENILQIENFFIFIIPRTTHLLLFYVWYETWSREAYKRVFWEWTKNFVIINMHFILCTYIALTRFKHCRKLTHSTWGWRKFFHIKKHFENSISSSWKKEEKIFTIFRVIITWKSLLSCYKIPRRTGGWCCGCEDNLPPTIFSSRSNTFCCFKRGV